MRKTYLVRDGAKERNYPSSRKSARGRKCFQWKHDQIGRAVLVYLWCSEQRSVSFDEVSVERDFKENGLTEEALMEIIRSKVPDFPGYFRAKVGLDLKGSTVYGRVHKMLYDNKAPKQGGARCKMSTEYPPNHLVLRRIIAPVQNLLHRGTPVALDELERAGCVS
jgi:hypothetical protein